jgi:hypothetical protein
MQEYSRSPFWSKIKLVCGNYMPQIQNTAASYKLQAASQYRIQLKAKSIKPKAVTATLNTAASYKLQAASQYRIQLKAKSIKPKAVTATLNTAASKYRIA